ncbi:MULTISPECIES: alpha-L-arabinofuranosidase [unclassified Mucilaginibacter]|uniref:alpha-L-arabinofuranosidase n=2 Tax=Mucilaginibacter TaxID=423349 RepID=UPI002AC8C77A|nr:MULTISPECIES: alpha-L-arabinofuranosidase [unclassified Mucilaginibacter]WPX23373.1 alpha-L-arabinofuranosidase [Mucilaginibacter sp. 5C4]
MKMMIKGTAVTLATFIALVACKKDGATVSGVNKADTTGNNTVVIKEPVDPAVGATQGFFLDGWQPKQFTLSNNIVKATKPAAGNIIATVDVAQVLTKASKKIYGNNTNPYMGPYITDPILMNYLTKLEPNILRFPGGSLSDVYFWNKGDNTPPADVPATLQDAKGVVTNANYWYGNSPGGNAFTLDNYYKVLQQTNSAGIITVNYGYARYGKGPHPDQTAAHLAADWVRYDKGRTKYWEIGNENWGNWEAGYHIDLADNKDGQPQILTGLIYGTHFKLFADSMRKAAAEVGNTGIKIGMVITEADEHLNPSVITPAWNADVLRQAGTAADFYVVHNYYTPYFKNSTPAEILATASSVTKSTMDWVKTSASAAGVTQKPVALDEWNIFATGSQQMVSNVAGLHAAMVLGEVLKNQFSMASRWDLANGWDDGNDHGLFNKGDEPGADKWNPRPAYYYMYFFQRYFGDRMVNSSVAGSGDIVSYGSSYTSGHAGVVLVNKGSKDQAVMIKIKNFVPGTKYYYHTLNGGTDNAPFSRKVFVNGSGPAGVSGGPLNFMDVAAKTSDIAGGITVNVPALGVVFLVAEGK